MSLKIVGAGVGRTGTESLKLALERLLDADFITGIFGRFTLDIKDPEAAMAAYHAHNQAVRDTVPASRLIGWQPGDGWGPICRALGSAEPDEDFPHVNTTAMFQQRLAQVPED